MTEWPTVDEVIAQWNEGHGCVAEPSPSLHPALLPAPDVVNVPGTPFQVIRRADGMFDVWDGYRWRSACHDTLSAAYAAALDLPRGASRETAGVERQVVAAAAPPADPLAFFRGLGWAMVLSAPLWVAVVIAWRRWA